ncbi:MAG: isoprenylcysteine carboxylmethyltransferase family protein [Oscillospiraceae bacterium]|nr:isoprenylcysteine carboxylmethyltransferase family protein [Oscillospiraceae bacterium]
MANKQKHLPLLGVGPVYVIIIVAITAVIMFLNFSGKVYVIRNELLQIPLALIGILLIILGIVLWAEANFKSRLDIKIKGNQLVTTGVYGWVRNPIYSAFLFLCTGALLFCNNLLLLFFPLLYWAFLSVLMINTEEKWLTRAFGTKYSVYKSRVNRCILYPPRKNKQ